MFNTKLLFTVLVVLYYCTTVSTDQYYVVATDCQPADGECHPLSFYVAHSSSYFTDNTIFYFKVETHTLMNHIYVIGIQNVSFIGSNKYVIINSTFPLYIYNCTNISIVNITIVCEICDIHHHYNTYIVYSHDIAIFNVNTSSTSVQNSFEVIIYNSYITVIFNGIFNTSVHCYDTLQFHNLKVINSTLSSIELYIRHGTSYVLNVTLDNIILMKPDISPIRQEIILYSSSFYSANIINTSFYGRIYVTFQDYNYNASCQYPNTSIPIDSLVITNSYFFDRLFIFFSSVSNNQMISINFCSVHNGLYIVNHIYYQTLTMVSILIVNTQLSSGTNYINKIDNIIFSNVSISNISLNTGLKLVNSKLTINGSLTVSNNRAFNGGGMSLYGNSHLEIYPNSNLTFIGNHAANRGGGIYRETKRYETVCDIISIPNTTNVSFYFINNTAAAGDDIYGIGFTDPYCSIDKSIFKTNIKYLAPPAYVCFCTNSSIDRTCLQTTIRLYKFPGQKIYFNVIITNYYVKITAGSIMRYLNDTYIDTIQVGPKCTEISFTATVNSSAVNYVLNMYTDYSLTYTYSSTALTVPFSILPCPIGFTYTHGICTCSSSITAENVTCHIDTLQISHKGQLWIGPYNTSITFSADQPNHHNICLINEQCLLCNPSNVSFMLNDTDPQCQQHKSGTLCGSCTTGYSLVLGSNECMECTTNYNMALIILFAFMGIVLVVFLILLNLTVSVGTINGLLFTANIIKLYQPVFLGNQIPVPFFSQIVSWLNLDFGIKICFYNGMDRYVKEWLQFVFPFYVWAIIIVIILICRVSSKVSKLVGSNAVPVLATLLLLSYTKLLCTIVTVLHKRDITLHCHNSSHQLTVWYEDPTLQYAKGKHLYLFSFALIVLVLFCLPYTLFLLLNPLFEKYLTKYRLCSFLYKIKPVLDAYSGPMKDEYRFWPGLLLVARIPVLLSVTFAENLIQFRLLLLSILLSVLVVILTCFQRVYNNPLHNFIETWFIFMLTAMSVLTIASDSVRYTTIWYNVSIGVFTCSFIAIIGYHLYLKLDKRFPRIVSAIKEKVKSLKKDTSEDRSHLIKTPSYEVDRRDSITDLYEPVNTNDYTLPERDDTVPISVVDICNT